RYGPDRLDRPHVEELAGRILRAESRELRNARVVRHHDLHARRALLAEQRIEKAAKHIAAIDDGHHHTHLRRIRRGGALVGRHHAIRPSAGRRTTSPRSVLCLTAWASSTDRSPA